jgi:hypothetical protein
MKGLFIPEITAEMFRNGALESIEALMEEGEIYDIEYSPSGTAQNKETSEDVNFFGMTIDAERRVMKNAVRLIREVVDDYVFGCDSGNDDWRDYFTGYSDELDEEVKKAEFPSDFCYNLPSDEWLFKRLISFGTTRGGMGSACEECKKIGKIIKDDD